MNDEIICPFKDICLNYGKKCDKCRWNASIELKNYLVIKSDKDGKTVRYL